MVSIAVVPKKRAAAVAAAHRCGRDRTRLMPDQTVQDDSTMGLWKVVRPAARAAFRTVSRAYLLLSGRQYRFIFILGHMRSGSTLLSHILASHLDIVGAGEAHITYQTPADLPQLVLRTCEFLRRPVLRETYIVDQINPPYVTDDVLRSSQIYRCII